MFKHAWSVVASSSVVNREDNSLSLFNVVEGMNVEVQKAELDAFKKGEKIPLTVPHEIVSYIYRDDASTKQSAKVRLDFRGPTGKKASVSENNVVFEMGKQNVRVRIKVRGFAVSASGRYFYDIYLFDSNDKAKLVASLPLSINIEANEKN